VEKPNVGAILYFVVPWYDSFLLASFQTCNMVQPFLCSFKYLSKQPFSSFIFLSQFIFLPVAVQLFNDCTRVFFHSQLLHLLVSAESIHVTVIWLGVCWILLITLHVKQRNPIWSVLQSRSKQSTVGQDHLHQRARLKQHNFIVAIFTTATPPFLDAIQQ